eukprot:scaffold1308_cov247-Pinguiococcus_pyrenoidosus.AAC.5
MKILGQRIPQLRAVGEDAAIDFVVRQHREQHESDILPKELSPSGVDLLKPPPRALAAVPGRPPVLVAEDVPHGHVHMGMIPCSPLVQLLCTGGLSPPVAPDVHYRSREADFHLHSLERHHARQRRRRRFSTPESRSWRPKPPQAAVVPLSACGRPIRVPPGPSFGSKPPLAHPVPTHRASTRGERAVISSSGACLRDVEGAERNWRFET